MDTLDNWLITRGPQLVKELDQHRDQICDIVSVRLATVFPTLCYDLARPDAAYFQQHTYYEVPRRFQRVFQALLLFHTFAVIEQEYRWASTILPQYGVTRQHLLTQVRWYFDALRVSMALPVADLPHIETVEHRILQIVDQITAASSLDIRRVVGQEHVNGHKRNGTHA